MGSKETEIQTKRAELHIWYDVLDGKHNMYPLLKLFLIRPAAWDGLGCMVTDLKGGVPIESFIPLVRTQNAMKKP